MKGWLTLSPVLVVVLFVTSAPRALVATATPRTPTLALAGPGYASPGNPVRVVGDASGGPAGSVKTKFRLFLSKDLVNGAGDTPLDGTLVVPSLGAGKVARVGARPAVPAAARPGAYFVLSCAAPANTPCFATAAKVRVTATPRSTDALIEDALAAGEIDADTAIVYRIFGAFGDSRLPPKFEGETADGTAALRAAMEAWPGLPKNKRSLILPYLLPPAARGSWADPSGVATTTSGVDPDLPCGSNQFSARGWANVKAVDGKVRIWWPSNQPDLGSKAQAMVPEVGRIYAAIKQILQVEPISDAKVRDCYRGSDGALDIYIALSVTVGRGAKARYVSGFAAPYPPKCSKAPAFAVVDDSADATVFAHELWHVFTFAFPEASPCTDFAHFDEGAAEWAERHIVPGEPESFISLVLDPKTSLKDLDYPLWPFDLYLEHSQGIGIFRSLYLAFAKLKPFEALDTLTKGGLAKTWAGFMLSAWNRDPKPDLKKWGNIETTPPDRTPRPLALAGAKKNTMPLPAELPVGMTRQYRWVSVSDDKIRELKFKNPLAGMANARVWAFVKVGDTWTAPQDWTNRKEVKFCRDKAGEDVSELVVMYANTDFKTFGPLKPAKQPALDYRDACDGLPYYYKVLTGSFTTRVQTKFAATHPCRTEYFGGYTFTGTLSTPTGVVGNISLDPVFNEITGTIPFTAPAKKVFDIFHGCQPNPDHPLEWIPCDEKPADVIPDGGTWDSGIYLIEGTKGDAAVTAIWDVPQSRPIIGIPEPYGCDVQAEADGPDGVNIQQQIPLETLASTEPIDLVFTGTYSEKGTTLDMKPADFTTSWTIKMTIQRVDENGNPLG